MIAHGEGCLRVLCLPDQCVDKAKVDESEQKAAEFSKKVRNSSFLYPYWYAPSPLFFPELPDKLLICMPRSIAGSEATWSVSVLQESMRQRTLWCLYDAEGHKLRYVQTLFIALLSNLWWPSSTFLMLMYLMLNKWCTVPSSRHSLWETLVPKSGAICLQTAVYHHRALVWCCSHPHPTLLWLTDLCQMKRHPSPLWGLLRQ